MTERSQNACVTAEKQSADSQTVHAHTITDIGCKSFIKRQNGTFKV